MDKLTKHLGYPPAKIAVFRAIKLGDLLCVIPAMRALRTAFPTAHIALISLPWAEEFVRCYPQYFDEFIQFPGWPGLPEQPLDPVQAVAFLQRMQARQWDVVLQLQGNGTLVNAMLSLFGAKALAGYYLTDQRGEQWVQSERMQAYPVDAHEVLRHVGLMEFLGVAFQGNQLEFNVLETDRQLARYLLRQVEMQGNQYVCIHAGGISGRRWPEHQFAKVADTLAEQGYTVVLTGSSAELPIIDTVRRQMSYPAVSLVGQTTLGSLGAVLQEAALLISNDTGVAHLAVACQTPSVTVFTSADPAEWGPLNRIRHRVVPEQAADSVRQVLAEAFDLLNADIQLRRNLSVESSMKFMHNPHVTEQG